MRTIKLQIAYDGTGYVGWQRQPNGPSIQACLEEALGSIAGAHVDVHGASRTDAGVHALGQVAHFVTSAALDCAEFRNALNAMLPLDIAINSADEMPKGFHARRDAKSKRYLYRILVSRERQPHLINRCWHLRSSPDMDLMRKAAELLVGKRDFSSFRASGCASTHGVRQIDRIVIGNNRASDIFLAGEGSYVDFEFVGGGFLRHMIRNIVGTLVDIGVGKLAIGDLDSILEACDREQAGRCAPACGLYLMNIFY